MHELCNIIYVSQSTTDTKPLPVTEAAPKTNHLWKVGQREAVLLVYLNTSWQISIYEGSQ